jgi:hypothetical protein
MGIVRTWAGEGRNPKHEIRNKFQAINRKSQIAFCIAFLGFAALRF